jgi:hypothetical protein
MKKKEIIKDIIGFEGLYKITSFGRIIRCYKERTPSNSEKVIKMQEKELKISGRVNYPTVALYKDGRQYSFSMHILIAIHFIKNDNPLLKTEINHKDKDIFNYKIENLEWISRSENCKHSKKR